MKLSLALSALLVGGSLFMSGCGSDSSSNDTKTQSSSDAGNSSSAAAVEAPKFTTEMLAGKTFYTYFPHYDNGFQGGTATMQFNFSADATTVEAIDAKTGENYGSALPVTINGNTMAIVTPDGESHRSMLLKVDGNNMFIFEGAPALWSATQLGDNGTAILGALLKNDKLTNEVLAANTWSNMEIVYDDNGNSDYDCKNTFTFKADGTGSTPGDDGKPWEFTYSIGEDDQFSIQDSDMHMVYWTKSDDILFFTDNTLFFKSKAAAKSFLLSMGQNESDADSCVSNFTE